MSNTLRNVAVGTAFAAVTVSGGIDQDPTMQGAYVIAEIKEPTVEALSQPDIAHPVLGILASYAITREHEEVTVFDETTDDAERTISADRIYDEITTETVDSADTSPEVPAGTVDTSDLTLGYAVDDTVGPSETHTHSARGPEMIAEEPSLVVEDGIRIDVEKEPIYGPADVDTGIPKLFELVYVADGDNPEVYITRINGEAIVVSDPADGSGPKILIPPATGGDDVTTSEPLLLASNN